jgi:hypothetical protein
VGLRLVFGADTKYVHFWRRYEKCSFLAPGRVVALAVPSMCRRPRASLGSAAAVRREQYFKKYFIDISRAIEGQTVYKENVEHKA